MGRYSSVIVFVIFITSSVIASLGSYRATQEQIVDELNRALMKTVAEKHGEWITTDTIKAYRQLRSTAGNDVALNFADKGLCRHISIPQLRTHTYMRVRILDGTAQSHSGFTAASNELCSDTVVWHAEKAGANVALRSYARCSTAMIFGMSDQRLPLAFLVIALLSLSSVRLTKKEQAISTGTSNDTAAYLFENATEQHSTTEQSSFEEVVTDMESIRFTPMQHKLMQMFVNAEDHSLTKTEICEALWPKKDDASETLYTLIRRLKLVLEANSNMRIEADRGRAYRLTIKQME